MTSGRFAFSAPPNGPRKLTPVISAKLTPVISAKLTPVIFAKLTPVISAKLTPVFFSAMHFRRTGASDVNAGHGRVARRSHERRRACGFRVVGEAFRLASGLL